MMANNKLNDLILGTDITQQRSGNMTTLDVRLPMYTIKVVLRDQLFGNAMLRDSIIPVAGQPIRQPQSVPIRMVVTAPTNTLQAFLKLPDGSFKPISNVEPVPGFGSVMARLTSLSTFIKHDLSIERQEGLSYDIAGFLMDSLEILKDGRLRFVLGFQRMITTMGSDFTVAGTLNLHDLGTGAKSLQEAVGDLEVFQPGSRKPDKKKATWTQITGIVTAYRTFVNMHAPDQGPIKFIDGKIRMAAMIPLGRR